MIHLVKCYSRVSMRVYVKIPVSKYKVINNPD